MRRDRTHAAHHEQSILHPSQQQAEKGRRISSFEVLRCVAYASVAAVHIGLFVNVSFYLGVLLNQAARFAVPFFFAASGYFCARKVQLGESELVIWARQAVRLLRLFLCWSIVYAIFGEAWFLHSVELGFLEASAARVALLIADLQADVWTVMLEGTSTHLWFLPALVLSLLPVALMSWASLPRVSIIGVSVVLYVVGLLGGSYAGTSFGIDMPINTRNGPFFGALFCTMGWLFASLPKPSARLAWGMVVGGLLVQLVEAAVLTSSYGPPRFPDFFVGTIPFGLGVFLIGLALPDLGRGSAIPRLGGLVLGAYLTHMLVIYTAAPIRYWTVHWAWEIGILAAVILGGFGLAAVLKKLPIVRVLMT